MKDPSTQFTEAERRVMDPEEKKAVHEKIHKAAREVVLVDGHAHNLVELGSSFTFMHAFVEAGDEMLVKYAPHQISVKRSVRDVAELYRVEPTVESIQDYRERVGLRAISKQCFDAANMDTLLLDDGLVLDQMHDIPWHRDFVKNVHRIARVEALAEDILKRDPPHGLAQWNFKALEEEYISTLKSLVPSVVGFKSIVAYRSGLNVDPDVTDQDAEEGLLVDRKLAADKRKHVRLQNKYVIDRLFVTALLVATENGLPLQIHTGFGDKDLDMSLANPVHLKPVLEDIRFESSRLVLLHTSYPYMRLATYLASVYPQVYVDFGLAIPKLTVRGMAKAVEELMELAPLNKVMFSTDGYAFPETFFLGAKWSRLILAQFFCGSYDDGDLTGDECVRAVYAVFRDNALAFYKLKDETSRRPPSSEV